jgi:large subunit ribosomal protein L9
VRVILRSEVKGLGAPGEVKDVADGYARNFLLPRGLAVVASGAAIRAAEEQRDAAKAKKSRDRAEAEELAARLADIHLSFVLKSGAQGRVFGSVTTRDIADALAERGLQIERGSVHLQEPLRALGTHRVEVRLHPQVRAQVAVRIEAAR